MNGRKALSLALAGIAVMSLAFGTGAFTSVSAERGVSVSVVDDDSAYVGYNTSNVVVTEGENANLVTVKNQFSGPIEIEAVAVTPSEIEDNLIYPDGNISTGSNANIAWENPDCQKLSQSTVSVTVEVAGTGVWAKIFGDTRERKFEVTCEETAPAARFTGAGNFELLDAEENTVNITYWNKSLDQEKLDEFNTSSKLQNQTDKGQPKIVAVYVEEYDVTYIHPNFSLEADSPPPWGEHIVDEPVEGYVPPGS